MANNNTTTNLKLTLPVEENINWAGTINDNFEKIDDAVGKIEEKYTKLVNTNIDNAAIFIDDAATAVNFYNVTNTEQLILGNIGIDGFNKVDPIISAKNYSDFTKGRCFYVYCGISDNASYKGNINNTPPYNMDWTNGDIMVFDKEYRNGQYQVSFRKMPQVLGKKYLNQYSLVISIGSTWETEGNFYTRVLDTVIGPYGKTPIDDSGNPTFPNIECNFFYYDPDHESWREAQPWEKIQIDYRISKEVGTKGTDKKPTVKLWVKKDDSFSNNGRIWAIINYRNE